MKSLVDPPSLDTFSGEEELRELRAERKRLSENHYNRAQSLAGWLFATLVASNGAAALAVLSNAAISNKGPAIPFAAGVILAIAAGRYSWREAQDRTGLHYLESLRDEQITNEGRRKFELWKGRSRRFALLARATMLLSLWALIAGCGLIYLSV